MTAIWDCRIWRGDDLQKQEQRHCLRTKQTLEPMDNNRGVLLNEENELKSGKFENPNFAQHTLDFVLGTATNTN